MGKWSVLRWSLGCCVADRTHAALHMPLLQLALDMPLQQYSGCAARYKGDALLVNCINAADGFVLAQCMLLVRRRTAAHTPGYAHQHHMRAWPPHTCGHCLHVSKQSMHQ